MKTLSDDLRRRIVEAREQGAGVGEVAKRFGVSRSSVERFHKQYRRRGHWKPKRRGGYRKSALAGHGRRLRAWIAKTPDLTLEELRDLCARELNVSLGINALWHCIDKLGLSHEKNDARCRARQAGCAGGKARVEAPAAAAAGAPACFHR